MKSRNKFLIGGVVILTVIIALSVQELKEKTVFFYTPGEILANPSKFENQPIRIGALVQKKKCRMECEKTIGRTRTQCKATS